MKTLFPELPAKYRLLCDVLKECRVYLRAKPEAGLPELENYICDQGDREILDARPSGVRRLFQRFLPWMCDVLPFVNLGRLREHGPVRAPACEAIGKYWGTTPDIIRGAIEAKPIPPPEMRTLILLMSPAERKPEATARKHGKRGPRPQPQEAKTWYKIGLQVEEMIPVSLKKDRHSIVAARRTVANSTRLQFDAVAEYHRRFRQLPASKPL